MLTNSYDCIYFMKWMTRQGKVVLCSVYVIKVSHTKQYELGNAPYYTDEIVAFFTNLNFGYLFQ